MILYHGSNIEVTAPRIFITNRALDFGSGFYTTSDFKQAESWAQLTSHRRNDGSPTVSIFEFDKITAEKNLKVRIFESANKDWLNFVASNRKRNYIGEKFDIFIGPVANDNTMPVISDFMLGNIDENTALILLKPQKLTDQYAFLTKKGLSFLKFMEVKYYD